MKECAVNKDGREFYPKITTRILDNKMHILIYVLAKTNRIDMYRTEIDFSEIKSINDLSKNIDEIKEHCEVMMNRSDDEYMKLMASEYKKIGQEILIERLIK